MIRTERIRQESDHALVCMMRLLIAIVALYLLTCTVALADKPIIYHVDLRYTSTLTIARCYDIRHAAVCVQGLVNSEAPRIFLSFVDADINWLDRMRETGGLCEGWSVRTLTFSQMLTFFRHYIKGVVLYDPDPDTGAISTSLVATTVAGVEGGIAIRKDPTSPTYRQLTDTLGLAVLVDLAGKFTGSGTIWQTTSPSTGSAKCDAYIWAKEKYIDSGRCNPAVLSYTLDLYGLKTDGRDYTQLPNLDYAISRKGFCFELSPWGDEKPNDDLNQPLGADLAAFKSILDACNQQTGKSKMIKLCGFPNWHLKYSNYTGVGGTHEPYQTEREMVEMCTAYNTYMEADAPNPVYIANGSFYAGLLPGFRSRRYVQNPPPTYDDMVSRGLIKSMGQVADGNYILMGMGDYDQASWTLYLLAGVGGFYDDSARGQVYCSWGVDPNAIDRASVAMDYMYRHKSSKDYFIGWDSGAGYIFPGQLYGARSPSGYPSAVSMWQEHCKYYYRLMDYSITGFMLMEWGTAGSVPFTTADCVNYAPFSGDGMGVTAPLDFSTPVLVNGIAVDTVNGGGIIDYASGVHFASYHTVVNSPTQIKDTADSYVSSGHNHRFLDAYTYNYLLRYYLGGNNNYRATWVDDTTPRIMKAGQTYAVTVAVRNDGWDTWSESSGYYLGYAKVTHTVTPVYDDYDRNGRCPIPSGSVSPGQSVTFTVNVTAPSSPGTYDLYYDMVQDGVTWFRDKYNLECVKQINVVDDPSSVDTDGDGVPDVTEETTGGLYWHPGDSFAFGPVTPAAPSDGGAYSSSSTITFSWSAPLDQHYSVIGYYCQVGTTPGGNDVHDGYVDNALIWSITGCINGTTYYCRVQAVNDAGYVSGWSASSDGITYDITPPVGSIAINGGESTTNAAQVVLVFTALDNAGGLVDMRLSNDGTVWGDWHSYVPSVIWILAEGANAQKTVYVQFRDGAGNVSTYNDSITTVAANPVFSPTPGTYGAGENVIISCATEGAAIHYTTDGVSPTESSPVYTGPILLDASKTVKARAYKPGWMSSSEVSASYSVLNTSSVMRVGLLVRVWGKVTNIDSSSKCFFVSDGSDTAGFGVMIDLSVQKPSVSAPELNSYVSVTGVTSVVVYNGTPTIGVLPRSQGDIAL